MAKAKKDETVYDYDANNASAAPAAAAPKAAATKPKFDFTKLNTLAVVSLASAVTGFGAVAAVVTGHISLAQIKRSGQAGRGLAVTGVVLGYAVVALWILSSIGIVALGILGLRNGNQIPNFGDHNGNGFGFGHTDDGNGFQLPQGQAGQSQQG